MKMLPVVYLSLTSDYLFVQKEMQHFQLRSVVGLQQKDTDFLDPVPLPDITNYRIQSWIFRLTRIAIPITNDVETEGKGDI